MRLMKRPWLLSQAERKQHLLLHQRKMAQLSHVRRSIHLSRAAKRNVTVLEMYCGRPAYMNKLVKNRL